MVEFSYEDLYELLRTEKFSTDLQPLTSSEIKKIISYLIVKKTILGKQSQSSEFFSEKNVNKIKTEIDNAKRILKDIFERRQRKIINRAMLTARSSGSLKDSTNMLSTEENLYNQLVDLLSSNSQKFFDYLTTAQEKPKELKTDEKNPEQLKVKVLEDLPEMTDSKLKTYGPYETNEVIDLPEELTTILKKHGKIIEIENESA